MPTVRAQSEKIPPLRPSDTSSPRATLKSFLAACTELYELAKTEQKPADFTGKVLPAAERIRDCLDLSALPAELRETVGVEAGVFLKEVLDRIELPKEDAIPDANKGKVATERWQVPGTRITIARIDEGPQKGAYQFTAETVRTASQLYRVAKQLPYRSGAVPVSPGFHDLYTALTKRQPTLSADTSSPRGTLTLFLTKSNEAFEIIRAKKHIPREDPAFVAIVGQIFGCLDFSEIPEYSRDYYAGEAAVCLKEVLDRVALPPVEAIPGPENLQATQGSEPLTRWQIPNTHITIARVADGPRRGEYLFTSDTVARAVEMYHAVKGQPYRKDGRPVSPQFYQWFLSTPQNTTVAAWVNWLPKWSRLRYFSLAIWQWLGFLLASAAGLFLMLIIYRYGRLRSEAMRKKGLLHYWLTMTFTVLAMLVPLAFKYVVWQALSIRGTPLYFSQFAANLIFLLALIVFIIALTSRLADSMTALSRHRSNEIDATLVQILFRVLGLIAAAIVFLEGGRFLGFPITTLLASAGIGGLAIALSAQGMVKGLFGTVTILLDRPYSVGERITAKGHDGIVEEIGLRSTKIRAFLTNHLISIPNDQMADTEIENIGKRKHIRRMTDLHIPIDSARDKVEKAVEIIRETLANHEGMDPEFPPRVYFNEFNPDSFNIRIIYWYAPPDLWNYYAFCEKVNLQVFRAFDEHGIQFSLPFRHSFWSRDAEQGPLDVRLAQSTNAPVEPPPSHDVDGQT